MWGGERQRWQWGSEMAVVMAGVVVAVAVAVAVEMAVVLAVEMAVVMAGVTCMRLCSSSSQSGSPPCPSPRRETSNRSTRVRGGVLAGERLRERREVVAFGTNVRRERHHRLLVHFPDDSG